MEDHPQHPSWPLSTGTLPVFQAVVDDVLGEMLNKFVLIYLDDILIFFQSSLLSKMRSANSVLCGPMIKTLLIFIQLTNGCLCWSTSTTLSPTALDVESKNRCSVPPDRSQA